jgi:hypothetical protein
MKSYLSNFGKRLFQSLGLTILFLFQFKSTFATENQRKDTIRVGIYITSIHDIDFKNQEYDINFWMWLDYRFANAPNNKSYFSNQIQLLNSIEIPLAKSFEMKFIDTTTQVNHLLTKVHCVMKDNWNIKNFPFDHQQLRLSIENSVYDSNKVKLIVDANYRFYDTSISKRLDGTVIPKIIQGWELESVDTIKNSDSKRFNYNKYLTNFGDTSIKSPTIYSAVKFIMKIHRNSWSLFWKMMLCMYLAFFIAYVSFFIHYDSFDSRLSLGVGALFAVIGNKYIVEASLPESTSFTLVDLLHAITMFFILFIISVNTISLGHIKNDKLTKFKRLNKIYARYTLIIYITINVILVAISVLND